MRHKTELVRAFGTAALALMTTAFASAQDTNTIFPLVPPTVSTIPQNGDVNPYGVAFAPKTLAPGLALQAGDILVSNFNNAQNLQGTGTSITRIDKAGTPTTFFQGSKRGLSAALGILSNGAVFIGNTPTADGTSATVQAGSLSVVDGNGNYLGTLGTIATVNGPWGMAVYDKGSGGAGTAHVFLSNVLSGVVSRFDITYTQSTIGATVTVIANGFSHRFDPAALVLGPSGMAYDAVHDLLYVTNSADNSIYTIANAVATQSTVSATQLVQDYTHLHGPLDVTILPNGHLVVANSDGSNADPNQPSELVEYTPTGQFLGQMPVDPNNGGAFGLSTYNIGWGTFRMAAVDDNANNLHIWTLVAQ
jgi:hypothetical protein